MLVHVLNDIHVDTVDAIFFYSSATRSVNLAHALLKFPNALNFNRDSYPNEMCTIFLFSQQKWIELVNLFFALIAEFLKHISRRKFTKFRKCCALIKKLLKAFFSRNSFRCEKHVFKHGLQRKIRFNKFLNTRKKIRQFSKRWMSNHVRLESFREVRGPFINILGCSRRV